MQDTQQDASPLVQPAPRTGAALEIDWTADFTQIRQQFILVPTNRGFLVVNQQLAHERVLYERLADAADGKPMATQRSLFPISISCTPADAVLVNDLLPDLQQLGYALEPFGANSFVIQGTPADVEQGNEKQVIEQLLEQFKHFTSTFKFSKREKLVRSMVSQQSIKAGKSLSSKEMHALISSLFGCATTNTTIDGAPTYIEFRQEQLARMFQ
jgi:DNA mismatch repair protein MutL